MVGRAAPWQREGKSGGGGGGGIAGRWRRRVRPHGKDARRRAAQEWLGRSGAASRRGRFSARWGAQAQKGPGRGNGSSTKGGGTALAHPRRRASPPDTPPQRQPHEHAPPLRLPRSVRTYPLSVPLSPHDAARRPSDVSSIETQRCARTRRAGGGGEHTTQPRLSPASLSSPRGRRVQHAPPPHVCAPAPHRLGQPNAWGTRCSTTTQTAMPAVKGGACLRAHTTAPCTVSGGEGGSAPRELGRPAYARCMRARWWPVGNTHTVAGNCPQLNRLMFSAVAPPPAPPAPLPQPTVSGTTPPTPPCGGSGLRPCTAPTPRAS